MAVKAKNRVGSNPERFSETWQVCNIEVLCNIERLGVVVVTKYCSLIICLIVFYTGLSTFNSGVSVLLYSVVVFKMLNLFFP